MTFLQTLGPGSTLIAPAYLHAALREGLLKTRSGMLGLKLNTLQGWLQQQTNVTVPSRHVALYQYKQRILTILPQLKIYREVADSPVFLNECRAFLDSLNFWNIPLKELPQESEAQKELFSILTQLNDKGLFLGSNRIDMLLFLCQRHIGFRFHKFLLQQPCSQNYRDYQDTDCQYSFFFLFKLKILLHIITSQLASTFVFYHIPSCNKMPKNTISAFIYHLFRLLVWKGMFVGLLF